VAFLYPLFFTSGIPALLYQVMWQRSLFTIYGTNTESAAAVVAAFLLGLGAFSPAGRRARWPTRLLIIYGVIEFEIGLFGFVSHFPRRDPGAGNCNRLAFTFNTAGIEYSILVGILCKGQPLPSSGTDKRSIPHTANAESKRILKLTSSRNKSYK
jgi:hypothetical protein